MDHNNRSSPPYFSPRPLGPRLASGSGRSRLSQLSSAFLRPAADHSSYSQKEHRLLLESSLLVFTFHGRVIEREDSGEGVLTHSLTHSLTHTHNLIHNSSTTNKEKTRAHKRVVESNNPNLSSPAATPVSPASSELLTAAGLRRRKKKVAFYMIEHSH